jgi:hypothetical protein
VTVLVSETTLAIELPDGDDLVVRRTHCRWLFMSRTDWLYLDQGGAARRYAAPGVLVALRAATRRRGSLND